jgi:hypothetical protein
VRTRDQFDLFVGTSTGSIVAAGLAVADFPVAVITRLYLDLARVIFGSRLTPAQRSCRLRAILSCVFGRHTSLLAAAATAEHRETQKRSGESGGSGDANSNNQKNNLWRISNDHRGGRSSNSNSNSNSNNNDNNNHQAPPPTPHPPKYFCAVATDVSTMQFRPYLFRSFVPPGGGGAALHDGLSFQVGP